MPFLLLILGAEKKNKAEWKWKRVRERQTLCPWLLIFNLPVFTMSEIQVTAIKPELLTDYLSFALSLSPSLVSRSGWNVVTALRWCCRGLKSPSAYYPVRLNMQVEARGPTLKLQFAGPSTQCDNNTHTDTVLRLYTHTYTHMCSCLAVVRIFIQ